MKSAAIAPFTSLPVQHPRFRASKVPVAIQPCNAQNFQIVSVKKEIKLSTNALTVSVDTETGALTFLSGDGKTVLAEPKEGGKQFDVPSLFEAKTWQVQQTFLSPPDEALYGLGQHQEGILNVRGIPIRLHQANTNISVPFMLSSKGYGLLWNNPSLTDFNPADQPIELTRRRARESSRLEQKAVTAFCSRATTRINWWWMSTIGT